VFMCSVWISEETVIISLCSINWLVCITETETVYCAVRTHSKCYLRTYQTAKARRNYKNPNFTLYAYK